MITIVGTVRRCEVRDISKRAGVENRRSYVTLAVESVEPAEARGGLRGVEEFVGAAPFDFEEMVGGVNLATHEVVRWNSDGTPCYIRRK